MDEKHRHKFRKTADRKDFPVDYQPCVCVICGKIRSHKVKGFGIAEV